MRRGVSASTSTGSVIAVMGVALALMVMELSLAVSSGFKNEIERKVIGFDAPVTILPAYDYYTSTSESELQAGDSLMDVINDFLAYNNISEKTRVAPGFKRYAILKTDNDFLAVECLAHGDNHDFDFERRMMTEGSFPNINDTAAPDSIVISAPIARKLNLSPKDKAYLYFFVNDTPKARRVFVSGLYQSNFGEYDDAIIYTSMALLQGLGEGGATEATSIALEGIEKEEIQPLSEALQQTLLGAYSRGELSKAYPVTNVFHTGALFFNWLDLLDTNVIVIFILMICVSAFTLISSLFIIILDRVPTIGVLRSLGATRSQVSGIFMHLAMRLVGLGMIIGNVLALGLIFVQNATHFLPLDPQMYYLAYVPFEISWMTVLWLNLGVAVGAWLILILPARLAARVDPASTMRYE